MASKEADITIQRVLTAMVKGSNASNEDNSNNQSLLTIVEVKEEDTLDLLNMSDPEGKTKDEDLTKSIL